MDRMFFNLADRTKLVRNVAIRSVQDSIQSQGNILVDDSHYKTCLCTLL
jgi:hypothetical protein